MRFYQGLTHLSLHVLLIGNSFQKWNFFMALEHSITRDYDNHLTTFLGLNSRERLDLMISLPPSSSLCPHRSHTHTPLLSLTNRGYPEGLSPRKDILGEAEDTPAGVLREVVGVPCVSALERVCPWCSEGSPILEAQPSHLLSATLATKSAGSSCHPEYAHPFPPPCPSSGHPPHSLAPNV